MGAALARQPVARPWPRLMGAEDAADYLSVSETTLRALGIACRRIGRRALYDIRDLDRYVDRMDEATPPEVTPAAAADEERRFFEQRRRRGRN